MIIYKAQNKITGKIYIGQTIYNLNIRIAQHLRGKRNHSFSNALKKYGIQSFEFSIIDSTLLREIADEKEKYWIKFYRCKAPEGYNLTDGGSSKFRVSEETKKKMSKTRKGMIIGPPSDETKRKISNATWGKKHPHKGHPCSKETRKKMSTSNLGKHFKGKPRAKHS